MTLKQEDQTRPSPIIRQLMVLGVVAILAATVLSVSSIAESSDLRLILYFAAGAFTMAALSILSYTFRPALLPARHARLTFNAAIVTLRIDEGWRKLGIQPVPPPELVSPTELSSRTLLGEDNSLALAYLRMEIERTLRKILNGRGLNWAGVSLASARRIMEGLVAQGVIDEVWQAPMHEVMNACNRAVHGASVSDETALAVISSGEQILQYLHSLVKPAKEAGIKEATAL